MRRLWCRRGINSLLLFKVSIWGEVADTLNAIPVDFCSRFIFLLFSSQSSEANLFNCNHTFLRSLTAIYVRCARGCIVVKEAIAKQQRIDSAQSHLLHQHSAKLNMVPIRNQMERRTRVHAGLPCSFRPVPSVSSLDVDNCHTINMQIFHSMWALCICYVIIAFDARTTVKMLYNSICILLNCVCSSSLVADVEPSQFHVQQFCAHHHINRNIYMVLDCRGAPPAHFWASATSTKDWWWVQWHAYLLRPRAVTLPYRSRSRSGTNNFWWINFWMKMINDDNFSA